MCLCGCEHGEQGDTIDKEEKLKAFLICPVRGHEMDELEALVAELEKTHDVHWPHRDTDQSGGTGLRICWDNYNAIADAEHVFVVWNGESKGSHFDLGIAFALGKTIEPVKWEDKKLWYGNLEPTESKSFNNMINKWSDLGPLQSNIVTVTADGHTFVEQLETVQKTVQILID